MKESDYYWSMIVMEIVAENSGFTKVYRLRLFTKYMTTNGSGALEKQCCGLCEHNQCEQLPHYHKDRDRGGMK